LISQCVRNFANANKNNGCMRLCNTLLLLYKDALFFCWTSDSNFDHQPGRWQIGNGRCRQNRTCLCGEHIRTSNRFELFMFELETRFLACPDHNETQLSSLKIDALGWSGMSKATDYRDYISLCRFRWKYTL